MNLTNDGYSSRDKKDKWSAEYADRIMKRHIESSPMDHSEGSVTTSKIATGAVDGTKIAGKSIDEKHLSEMLASSLFQTNTMCVTSDLTSITKKGTYGVFLPSGYVGKRDFPQGEKKGTLNVYNAPNGIAQIFIAYGVETSNPDNRIYIRTLERPNGKWTEESGWDRINDIDNGTVTEPKLAKGCVTIDKISELLVKNLNMSGAGSTLSELTTPGVYASMHGTDYPNEDFSTTVIVAPSVDGVMQLCLASDGAYVREVYSNNTGEIEEWKRITGTVPDMEITEPKLAPNSVTSEKVAPVAIDLSHLANEVLTFIEDSADGEATDMCFDTPEQAVAQGYPECVQGLSYKFSGIDLRTELFIAQDMSMNNSTQMYYRFSETSTTYPWIKIASADEIQSVQKDTQNRLYCYDCGTFSVPDKHCEGQAQNPYDVGINGNLKVGSLIKFTFTGCSGSDVITYPVQSLYMYYYANNEIQQYINFTGSFEVGHTYICAVTVPPVGENGAYIDGTAVMVLDNGKLADGSITPSHLTEQTKALFDKKCGESVTGKEFEVYNFVDIEPVIMKALAGAEIFNDYAGNVAVGANSHAEGIQTVAKGLASHAEGKGCVAFGMYSHAQGHNTTAFANYSHAEGGGAYAGGTASHAEGFSCKTLTHYSYAGGYENHACSYAEYVHGKHAKRYTPNNAYNATGDAYRIGNGLNSAIGSNAFRVTFDGKVYAQSDFNSTGADYAEYFEWADKNTQNEDRVGYFVALDGDKIRKATSTDSDIFGIVSANPAVVGNAYEDTHHGMYERDIWGRVQYEYITVPAVIHDDGTEMLPAREEYTPKINPNYNSNMEYIPRSKRPEWSAVGMFGQLLVHDDGTCVVGGYCTCTDDGKATTSDVGYRVLSRVSDNIVKVLVK